MLKCVDLRLRRFPKLTKQNCTVMKHACHYQKYVVSSPESSQVSWIEASDDAIANEVDLSLAIRVIRARPVRPRSGLRSASILLRELVAQIQAHVRPEWQPQAV